MRRSILDKKGEVDWYIQMVYRLLFLTLIMFVSLKLVVSYFEDIELDTTDVEKEALFARIIYSPAITYEDNERVYIGIIDSEKFTQENLETNINFLESPALAVRLHLRSFSLGEREIFINEGNFVVWKPIAEAEIEGPGSTELIKKIFVAGVYVNEAFEKGILTVELVGP